MLLTQTLRAGLAAEQIPPKKRYTIKPVSLGGVLPGIDLDKALHIADALEDQEIAPQAPNAQVMILIDANLLIYAIDADSPHHVKARAWLEAIFE